MCVNGHKNKPIKGEEKCRVRRCVFDRLQWSIKLMKPASAPRESASPRCEKYTQIVSLRHKKTRKREGGSLQRDCWSPIFCTNIHQSFGFKSARAIFFVHYAPLSACVIARDITCEQRRLRK